jgi:hypothetical protein
MATFGFCLQARSDSIQHPGFRHSALKTRVNALKAQSGLLASVRCRSRIINRSDGEEMSKDKMVGFVGLGTMGGRMAANLQKAGRFAPSLFRLAQYEAVRPVWMARLHLNEGDILPGLVAHKNVIIGKILGKRYRRNPTLRQLGAYV